MNNRFRQFHANIIIKDKNRQNLSKIQDIVDIVGDCYIIQQGMFTKIHDVEIKAANIQMAAIFALDYIKFSNLECDIISFDVEHII